MQRKFGLLFLVMFLAMQLLATLHMAEHGFVEHKHYGHSCGISLYCEQAKIASAAHTAIIPPSNFFWVKALPAIVIIQPLQEYAAAIPRAPPAFLHS